MLIKSHYQLSDEEFESQFENYTLKPGLFSHEAHLRLAYLHIIKYGADQAEANMCNQIKGYAESLGIMDKFNMTVTIAAVKVVHHFMKKSGSTNFTEFINEYPRINTNFRELLMEHYSFNVFKSVEARKSYIAPDLIPFS